MSRASDHPIGAHVPVAGGLATRGLRYAATVGAEAIQVFLGSPRGWALSAGDPGEDAAFRDHVAQVGLPVFVHAAYLINFGSPTPETRDRSAASLRHALRRGREIGAQGVVVHTGSAVSGDRAAAMRGVREKVLPILDDIGDNDPELLFEPMAGQGQMLCATVEELGPYLDNLDRHPRAGVCFDTCHAFAAGHDLTAPDGVGRTLDALVATVGPDRLRLIHANDSKDACGSRRDRHENIGAGKIGEAPFAALFAHPATRGVPLIVETPGKEDAHARDIATLDRLRGDRST